MIGRPEHSQTNTFTIGKLEEPSPEDTKLSQAMMDYWIQFAKSGDPNVEGLPAWDRPNNKCRDLRWDRLLACRFSNDRLEAYPTYCSVDTWPAYTIETDEHQVMDVNITTRSGLRRDACDRLDKIRKVDTSRNVVPDNRVLPTTKP